MAKPSKSAIQISKLKPHLSKYLRAAQKGQYTTVLDRNIPVAVIGPIEETSPLEEGLDIIPAVRNSSEVETITVSSVQQKMVSLELLLAERKDR